MTTPLAFRHALPAAETVEITVDGRVIRAVAGDSVAAALLAAGIVATGPGLAPGQTMQPLCLMGSCFQCIATIDGVPHQRTCRAAVRAGMVIALTGAGPA